MSNYRLMARGVLRLADGAAIPADPGNSDWREYLAWVDAGGEPEPLPAPALTRRYIAKTTILRRASDAELEAFEAWLANTATPRQRALWRDAEGGLVAVEEVEPVAAGLFGAARAAEMVG